MAIKQNNHLNAAIKKNLQNGETVTGCHSRDLFVYFCYPRRLATWLMLLLLTRVGMNVTMNES